MTKKKKKTKVKTKNKNRRWEYFLFSRKVFPQFYRKSVLADSLVLLIYIYVYIKKRKKKRLYCITIFRKLIDI